jgi:Tim44-like domain
MLFLLAAPALAAKEDKPDDSESQTKEYGQIFGYVCAGGGGLAVLIGGYIVVKGLLAESSRGKNRFEYREQILDKKPMKQPALYLGEKVPDWKILNRVKATKAVLDFLSEDDERFDRKYVTAAARVAFLVVKASVEARTTKKLAERVTEGCLEKLQSEIKKLRENGQYHIFGDTEVTDIQVVHLEAPEGKKNHTFTALISVKSKDYYKDDKSGEVMRGDKKLYAYQEFWRFRRTKGKWLVERIRSSEDMDFVINAKNVLSQDLLDGFAEVADEEYLREFVAK